MVNSKIKHWRVNLLIHHLVSSLRWSSNMLRKLFTWFKSSGLAISLLVAAVAVALVAWLDYRYGINWPDVRLEAHGLVMDIFVFGILILAFNKARETRNLKRHYHEEIEDFRDWKSDEEKYREMLLR